MSLIKFNKTFIQTDVLCVKRYRNYILAGIGGNLFVYENDTLLLSEPVFIGERIHSICSQNDLILLKGGRQLSLVKLDCCTNEFRCQIISKIQCPDWIQDVVILENQKAGLVTAHNFYHCWDSQLGKLVDSSFCEEKCILYSCKIVGDKTTNLTVFAGTVFGDVVIWSPHLKKDSILQRLKSHNGAVFSIEVKPNEKLLTTTSDDRSLKVWSVISDKSVLQPEDWRKSSIQLIHNLFGHTARVWKSLILPDFYLTAGEDSQLIIWSRDGRMVKSLCLHQESGIRGLNCCEETKSITTGGEDGGINMFSLVHLTSDIKPKVVLNFEKNVSTKVSFTKRGFVYTANGACILVSDAGEEVLYENEKLSSYCLLEVSPKGDIILLGSIEGLVVVIDSEKKSIIAEERILNGRVYSIHWLGSSFLTCGPDGRLDLWEVSNGLKNINTMTLPHCRERWTTCAGFKNGKLIIGDRMGNIHVYEPTASDPLKSFRKIHGRLGVTDILSTDDRCLSIGRDGTVKDFTTDLTHSTTCKLPLEWPWKIVQYNDDTLILGFHSTSFVVWSMKNREIIATHDCGGGHRSCDYRISNDELNFLYVKDKKVLKVLLPLHKIGRIRNGFHGREINCLKILQNNPTIIVSGSEDTTLRISTIEKSEIKQQKVFKTHISSIRAVCSCCTESGKHIIVSVGGKGQIVIWSLDLLTLECRELINHRLQKEDKNWKSPSLLTDPETRIMCAGIIAIQNVIVVGCSDCKIRIFSFGEELQLLNEIPYSHCILNLCILNPKLLATMGTDGKVVFWNMTDFSYVKQIGSFSLHQSGINSFHFERVGLEKFILTTGGDDNLISVALVEVLKENVRLTQIWKNCTTHSCQITGIKILKNFLLTTSIDQRLTLWKWSWQEDKFTVEFLDQCMTDVADVQGMDAIWDDDSNILVTLHGKGLEVLKVTVDSSNRQNKIFKT